MQYATDSHHSPVVAERQRQATMAILLPVRCEAKQAAAVRVREPSKADLSVLVCIPTRSRSVDAIAGSLDEPARAMADGCRIAGRGPAMPLSRTGTHNV
jgi:hypothetical protein